LGRIGGRVAEIARALGMRVLAFDPYIAAGRAAALGVTPTASLEDLLASADVVSLHCPAIPETYRLIDAAALARMRPGSYLINVARGAVVDEDALVSALRDGHLAGAGLDVYESEPAAADHPLFSLPNTVCTPHIASYTTAGVLKMQVMACQQVALALRGERPTELVNPQVWGRHRVAGPQ
ncbi:MAG TPA: NAD(P)-dependent oxidoreductase, partial [Kouleothrix sp.]|nr:NAD(P)-dependent oxidoreductase [Kouleothrix sp.]